MPEEPENNNTPSEGGTEKTFTQADVDRIVAERVQRERAKFSDYDDLKEKAKRLKEAEGQEKSESEKLKEQVSQLQQERDQAKTESLRSTIASEKGLTAKQARRLSGSSRDELESDADDLLDTFGAKKDDSNSGEEEPSRESSRPPKESLQPGASSSDETVTDPDQMAEAVLKQARGGA